MHKTLEFAINEALESGRRSAMPSFLEREVREKIAHEIDLYFNGRERWSLDQLLQIVRGDKELWEVQFRNIRSSKVYQKTRDNK